MAWNIGRNFTFNMEAEFSLVIKNFSWPLRSKPEDSPTLQMKEGALRSSLVSKSDKEANIECLHFVM